MENFKTIKQAELEINPPKKDKETVFNLPKNVELLNNMILGKEEIREQIRHLIKDNLNDSDLGRIVRENFL